MPVGAVDLSSREGAPAGGAAPTAPATPKDEFLRLLVAQLRHQDPLEPQKGSEFVAQLAQFASLEQAAETNQRLGALAAAQSASSSAAYAGLVGRTATAKISQLTVGGADPSPPSLGVHLDGAATKTQLVVTDASGKVVRTIDLGARPAGDVDVPWDGRDANGVPLPPGDYGVAVKATVAGDAEVSGFATLRGPIRSLETTGGKPRFRIGAATVAPGDIIAIQQ
jgi:flagellar basal-body rod modification protein FlgD